MRDLLEELLFVAGEEDEDSVLEQLLRRAALSGEREMHARRETAQQSPSQVRRTSLSQVQERQTGADEPLWVERDNRPAQQTRESVWTELVRQDGDLTTAERAGSVLAEEISQTGRSAALVSQLGRSGRAALRAASANAPTPVREETGSVRREQAVVTDVKRVDRAFERDARRYDSSFYLY